MEFRSPNDGGATAAKEQGQTLEDELGALSLEYGHHVTDMESTL